MSATQIDGVERSSSTTADIQRLRADGGYLSLHGVPRGLMDSIVSEPDLTAWLDWTLSLFYDDVDFSARQTDA